MRCEPLTPSECDYKWLLDFQGLDTGTWPAHIWKSDDDDGGNDDGGDGDGDDENHGDGENHDDNDDDGRNMGCPWPSLTQRASGGEGGAGDSRSYFHPSKQASQPFRATQTNEPGINK